MRNNYYFIRYYVLTILVVLTFNANAQFTYVNIDGGYQGVSFNSEFGSSLTGIKSFSTSAAIISRFKRHIGVGAMFAVPVAQNFDFSFKNAKTSYNSTFSDRYISDPSERYYADSYDYNISHTSLISLFGRLYFDKIVNSYTDISISYVKIDETFSFYRPYVPEEYFISGSVKRPSIPETSMAFNEEYSLFSPGIKFGLSPHLTDFLYLDFNFGWDFLFLGSSDFEYTVPYKYNVGEDWHEFVQFESQATGVKSFFSIKLGLGYYF